MSGRRGYGAFSRPSTDDRGKGVPPLPAIKTQWLVLGIVGRTSYDIRPMATSEQVDEVADEVGYEKPRDWYWVNVGQRLDLLATHIIERSRDGGRAQHREFILSPSQYYERTRREIPMNHEQLQAVVDHVPWARLYRGPLREAVLKKNTSHMGRLDANDERARRIAR